MYLRMFPIIAAVVLLASACGTKGATPVGSPSASPTTEGARELPKSTQALTPTHETPAPSSAEKPPPANKEQILEELKRAQFSTSEWKRTNFQVHSVPLREFRGGGPGKDDIPPIDTPKFETVAQANKWLKDPEPVQTVEINGDARAYPQQILIWHEVVNDTVGGEPVTITY